MKKMTPNKFSLAAIRVWDELLKSPSGIKFLSDELEISQKFHFLWRDTDVGYEMYTEYFTSDIELLDHSRVVRALVPEVAREAGFLDFSETNLPISNQTTFGGHFQYVSDVPEGLLDHYIANKRQWINAFVVVCMRNNTLPPMCDFSHYIPSDPDSDPYALNIQRSYFDRTAPLVVMWTKDHWLKEFPHHEITEDEKQNLPDYELKYLEVSRPANKRFLDMVRETKKKPLRFTKFAERTYQNQDAPFRIKVAEACQDFWPKFMLLAFEMGCDVPIIETLCYVGAFDKR